MTREADQGAKARRIEAGERVAVSLLVLAALGCSGISESRSTATGAALCDSGVLTVAGPLDAVRVRYPAASPPERLLSHSMSPGMWITVEGGGWLTFKPSAPVLVGEKATIETYDVATGAPLCPLEGP